MWPSTRQLGRQGTAAIAGLMLAGCATPSAPPTIGGPKADAFRLQPNAATCVVTIAVTNHDNHPIDLHKADYTLRVGGATLAASTTLLQESIPAGSATVHVPVTMDNRVLTHLVQSAENLHGDSVALKGTLDGTLYFGNGLGDLPVPFHMAVTLPANQQAWGGTLDAPLGDGVVVPR